MLRKIVKHASGTLEIIWILLNLDNSLGYYLIINIENGWFPSLYSTLTLPMCAISLTRHCSRVHCSFTVLFSSPLCIIPLLTSIKSLHPQTDQREGLSVSLLIPSLLDKIDHRFHPNNNVLFSPLQHKIMCYSSSYSSFSM